jgi:hypothetical protein
MSRRLIFAMCATVLALVPACNGKVEMPAAPSAVAGCDLTINPPAQDTPPSGGSFHTMVTGACGWTAESDVDWISVTHGEGASAGSVTYSVRENPGSSDRVGRIHIGNEVLVVTQVAPECTFSVQPVSHRVVSDGGSAEFRVATDSRCGWSASSNEGWVTLGSTTGTGPQTVAFRVLPNTRTTERAAQIRVGAQIVTVQQGAAASSPGPEPPAPTPAPPAPAPPAPPTPAPTPAPIPPPIPAPPPPAPAPCVYSVSPGTFRDLPSYGSDNYSFTVKADTHCAWSASTGADWIRLGVASGRGSAVVNVTVLANNGTSARSARIEAAGTSIEVTQGGR